MHGRTLIGKNKTGIPIIRMFSTCQLSFSVTCRSQGYHYRSMGKKGKNRRQKKQKNNNERFNSIKPIGDFPDD